MAATDVGERWVRTQERGSRLGIWVLRAMLRLCGRRAAQLLLWFVSWYYVVVHAEARRASQGYLRRLGLDASLRAVHRHIRRFAEATLDRFLFAEGRAEELDVTVEGVEPILELASQGKGAIFLGAHLGSFEALQVVGERYGLGIHMLGYFRNARKINDALAGGRVEGVDRVIELDPNDKMFVFRVRDLVESGGLVGILGDRVFGGARSVTVPFLGSPARFPSGAYLVAAALGCPVFFAVGLYRGGRRYELICEPFADRIDLPRRGREEALRAQVVRYAARLEHHCRRDPANWFNFYDFWAPSDPGLRSPDSS